MVYARAFNSLAYVILLASIMGFFIFMSLIISAILINLKRKSSLIFILEVIFYG